MRWIGPFLKREAHKKKENELGPLIRYHGIDTIDVDTYKKPARSQSFESIGNETTELFLNKYESNTMTQEATSTTTLLTKIMEGKGIANFQKKPIFLK